VAGHRRRPLCLEELKTKKTRKDLLFYFSTNCRRKSVTDRRTGGRTFLQQMPRLTTLRGRKRNNVGIKDDIENSLFQFPPYHHPLLVVSSTPTLKERTLNILMYCSYVTAV